MQSKSAIAIVHMIHSMHKLYIILYYIHVYVYALFELQAFNAC